MPLEGLGPPVGVVPADLTVVVDVQPVEFVEPVGNGLQGGNKHTFTQKKMSLCFFQFFLFES